MARIAKSTLAAAAALIAASADAAKLGAQPTSELLTFFNAHAERFEMKPVKKFADRATAEKRSLELARKIQDAASAPPKAKEKKEPGDISAAVAETWKDPEVAATRSARHSVKVKGEVYKSVRAAFDALGLDLAKHVAFRGKLVKEGKAEFDGHKFELAPAA